MSPLNCRVENEVTTLHVTASWQDAITIFVKKALESEVNMLNRRIK